MFDRAHVRAAPGQAITACPGCGGALVDTGCGIWAHAIGVQPCLQSRWMVEVVARAVQTAMNGYIPVVYDDAENVARRALGALLTIGALQPPAMLNRGNRREP